MKLYVSLSKSFCKATWFLSKKLLAVLLSPVGFCLLIGLYALLGACIFRAIELPGELRRLGHVKEDTEQIAEELVAFTAKQEVLDKKKWQAKAEEVLKRYEEILVHAVRREGYDGHDEIRLAQWTFSGALLYCITVFTTIGYGSLVPVTHLGRVVTIVYASLGIPLMLITLASIAESITRFFTLVYLNVCCAYCRWKKRRRWRKRALLSFRSFRKHTLRYQKPMPVFGHGHPPKKRRRGRRQESKPIHKNSTRSLPEGRFVYVNNEGMLSRKTSNSSFTDSNSQKPAAPKRKISKMSYQERGNSHAEFDRKILFTRFPKSASGSDASNWLGKSAKESPKKEESNQPFCNEEPPGTLVDEGLKKATRTPIDKSPLSAEGVGFMKMYEYSKDLSASAGLNWSNNKADLRKSHNVLDKSIIHFQMEKSATSSSSDRTKSYIHVEERITPVPRFELGSSRKEPPPDQLSLHSSMKSIRKHNSVSRKEKMPISVGIVTVLIFIGLGAGLFSYWENWNIFDGAYFCFITMTTIGFGDQVPGRTMRGSQHQLKWLTCAIYLLVGGALIAMCFKLMQDDVIRKTRWVGRKIGLLAAESDSDFDSEELDNMVAATEEVLAELGDMGLGNFFCQAVKNMEQLVVPSPIHSLNSNGGTQATLDENESKTEEFLEISEDEDTTRQTLLSFSKESSETPN